MAHLHLVQNRLLVVTLVFLTMALENHAHIFKTELLLQRNQAIDKMLGIQRINYRDLVVSICLRFLLTELGIKA
jgi:hypothetical protein